MAQKFEYYRVLADRMIDNDTDRNRAFKYYQKMRRMEYDLPDKVRVVPGARKSIDPAPSDAVGRSTQIMSSRPPRLTVMPAVNSPAGRERANMIERILKWQLTDADRRRPVGAISDIFESAVLYGAVALNVIDLDHQIKVVESEEQQRKIQRARRYGRFVINTFNPMDVHVHRSTLGVECVLLAQERPAYEVAAEYPMAAKVLKGSIEDSKNIMFYHYLDMETSCIWVRADGMSKAILPPTNHDLPFMYWVAMMGGSTLDNNEEHRYKPLLYSVYRTGEWETKNVVDTLMTSDVIWKALPPVVMVQNATEDVTYDTGDPQRRVLQLPYGASGSPLPPQQVDPALFTISQEYGRRMQDSTLSTLLNSSGDIGSGTSFAFLNLQTQTALGALKPAKELTEKALAEMFTMMLLWSSYTGIDLVGYNMKRRSQAHGLEYVLPADEIDDENIYISVELDPDEPTDKMQRANTATLLQRLGYSNTSALEDMGVEDPEQEMDRAFEEKLDQNQLDMYILSQQQALQMQMQALQMQMQQQQQMQQMGMQQQMQQQQQAQQMAQQQELGGAIPGGQGFNPAMGGQPPAMAFPEGTRENVNGEMGMGMGMEGEM